MPEPQPVAQPRRIDPAAFIRDQTIVASPPLVPEIRFRPAAGLSTVRLSCALGVVRVKLASLLTVTGSSPEKVMGVPPTFRAPAPVVVALGV